jgi:translin
MEKLEMEIGKAIDDLKRREGAQDAILKLTRELVRECSVSVKLVHSGDMKGASERLKEAKGMLAKVRKLEPGFEYLAAHAYQEYVEITLLMAIVEKKDIPAPTDLGIPFSPYMSGLLDCIGELRRQMLEESRHGKRKEAEYYFEKMNWLYEATLPLRFSDSILPNFRKKQDVARVQVENARSELLRSR